MTQAKNSRKKKVKIFSELRQSLQEAVNFEQGGEAGLGGTELPPPPKPLTRHQIRAIRKAFNVSQAVFARMINVSANAVRSWEQGGRHPREATLKLLTIADKHPEILLAGE